MKNNPLKIKTALLAIFMVLSFFQISRAQGEFPERPEPPRLVNDLAGVLSGQQKAMLENKLVSFNQRTSTQIAIVTVKSLSGYDKADYAIKLSEKWGIGQKGKNNGILILVKPKTGNERGEVFVSVGYGLEAVVPDAVARQALLGAELLPAFKKNDYYTGLNRSTDVLISLTAGEYTADQYIKSVNKKGRSGSGGFIIIMVVLAIIFLFQRGNSASRGISSGQGFLGGLLLMDLLGGGGRSGGSWNDFSGGGGGDSGGGDFGGFGGGSFGGGGAGGSW